MIVQVDGLGYTYRGADAPAVRELGFEIQTGEIFGFLGPSGAGKSTVQRILTGLLEGFSGSAAVFGEPLGRPGRSYFERIGVSFELPNHFLRLTGVENLRYFAALYERPASSPQSVLEWVDLSDAADRRVGHYSKGMKTRLGLARALLHDPELLFLDEPTAGLDPVSARRVRELIRRQRELGKTVFLTTHDMAVADELCDRVAFIVDGRLAALDSPREFRLRHGSRRVRVELEGEGETTREFDLGGLADDPEFLATLRTGRVQTLHSLEASLEDVFIRVTGRSLK